MMLWASKNVKIQNVCLHQVDCHKNTRPFKEIMLFVWLTEKTPGPSLPKEKQMWPKICEPSIMALVELNGCAYSIRPDKGTKKMPFWESEKSRNSDKPG